MTIKGVLTGIYISTVTFLASLLVRALARTMSFTCVNFDKYRSLSERGEKLIITFWHGRLLMMPFADLGKPFTILVSRSRDGELTAKTVRHFGISSVRGSSSRGWFEGFKGLLKALRAGGSVAMTPDGPRGPARVVKPGCIQLARSTGLPLIPVTFSASKKKFLRAGIPSSSPTPSQRAFLSPETPCT